LFAESNEIRRGDEPTEIVASTALVEVLITETVLAPEFTTYILLFAESNAIPKGDEPTEIVASTALVEVLITETVLAPEFVTYILLFAESNAIPRGSVPTEIVASTAFAGYGAKRATEVNRMVIKNKHVICRE